MNVLRSWWHLPKRPLNFRWDLLVQRSYKYWISSTVLETLVHLLAKTTWLAIFGISSHSWERQTPVLVPPGSTRTQGISQRLLIAVWWFQRPFAATTLPCRGIISTGQKWGFRVSWESWGIPEKWLVFVGENPTKIWMRTGGSPILGHLHLCWYWRWTIIGFTTLANNPLIESRPN